MLHRTVEWPENAISGKINGFMSFHSLMFGWEYPPLHSGGLGIACHGMVRGLLKNGARVTLVLPTNSKDTADDLELRTPSDNEPRILTVESSLRPYEGTDAYALRTLNDGGTTGVNNLYGPNMGEAVERFTAMSVNVTQDIHPDIVHAHDWMTFDAGLRAASHHRVPVVMHVHATELDRTDFHPNQWIADKERNSLMKAHKVIAVSNYTKNLLIQQYGIPADKIAVVHNAHDTTHSPHPSTLTTRSTRHPLVLFLGRLTTQKNPWQFLQTAKIVHEHNPATQFVMAGDGPMFSDLVDRACELGLSDCIVFTGNVGRNDVGDLYRKASCFVMPSLSEPFGLVALEAVSHGVPVVLSKQSGAAEVLDHCFKVDFWDTERFADCILTILREEPLAQQLRAEAPYILRRLSWQNQAQHILSIYQNVLKI